MIVKMEFDLTPILELEKDAQKLEKYAELSQEIVKSMMNLKIRLAELMDKN